MENHSYPSIDQSSQKQYIAGNAQNRVLAQRTQTATDCAPTAAQEALSSVEGLHARARQLQDRLSAAADRLGTGLPPSDPKAAPRPVRSGIVGSIHSTIDAADEVLSTCHEYLNQIERQV